MGEINLFETIKEHVCSCSFDLQLAPNVEAILKMPVREYHVSIPVRMDDGTIRTFQGFRIQYNDARGPTKGGIRFHPNQTVDTIRGLAALMTWKCALHKLPLGGAKGGVICNPKEMSQDELERLSRAYVQALCKVIGPDRDVPAPDVYTNAQTMAWMMDEYSQITGKTTFGVVTGKPLSLGGSEGRDDSTAQGGWYVIEEAAKEIGLSLKGSTVAIQGFGNVGSHAARIAQSTYGCKVIAVSDSRGGILDRDGLDIPKVLEVKETSGSVANYIPGERISNETLLELDADILIPAALENAITKANVDKIKGKIIAEFANGPISHEADTMLFSRNAMVIPDILCNGGGVIVSYFEMVQNLNMDHWDEDEVYKRLKKRMDEAYREVYQTAVTNKISLRKAAYTIAVRNVVETMKVRGWI